jgi:hypothetical protein
MKSGSKKNEIYDVKYVETYSSKKNFLFWNDQTLDD